MAPFLHVLSQSLAFCTCPRPFFSSRCGDQTGPLSRPPCDDGTRSDSRQLVDLGLDFVKLAEQVDHALLAEAQVDLLLPAAAARGAVRLLRRQRELQDGVRRLATLAAAARRSCAARAREGCRRESGPAKWRQPEGGLA